ncbi:MAG: hypothetical protein ACXWEE_02920 [Thermoleophilaceae bacterium]
MARPFATWSMLACAGLVGLSSSALAQDPAAEVPDVAVSEPQAASAAAAYGIARASSAPSCGRR